MPPTHTTWGRRGVQTPGPWHPAGGRTAKRPYSRQRRREARGTVEALPRAATSEPGPVTSGGSKLATRVWGGGTAFGGLPGLVGGRTTSPSKSSRWPEGRPQATPVQAARPRLGQPVTHHHRIVTAAERPSGGPLRGHRGQLSGLRAQQPEPHALRGHGEVIATTLSTASRHQVSPKEALFPGADPA